MFHYMESENRQNIKFRAGCLYNYRAIVAFRRPLSYKQMDRGKKLSSSYKRNFDKFSPINLMSGGFRQKEKGGKKPKQGFENSSFKIEIPLKSTFLLSFGFLM